MENMPTEEAQGKGGKKEKKGLFGFLPIIILLVLIFSILNNLSTMAVSFVGTQLTFDAASTTTEVRIPGTVLGGSGTERVETGETTTYTFDTSADDPLSEALGVLSDRQAKTDGFTVIQLIVSTLLLIAAVFLLFPFFKKSRRFPKLFIWFLIIQAMFGVLSTFKSLFILLGPSALASSAFWLPTALVALVVAAWVVSMKRSERIRLTFVN